MDWALGIQALGIVIFAVAAFVAFVTTIEKYPRIGALLLILVLVLVFTALVYRILQGFE